MHFYTGRSRERVGSIYKIGSFSVITFLLCLQPNAGLRDFCLIATELKTPLDVRVGGGRIQGEEEERKKYASHSIWDLTRLWDVLNMKVGFGYRFFLLVPLSTRIISSLWRLMASWMYLKCKNSFGEAIVVSLCSGAAAACRVCVPGSNGCGYHYTKSQGCSHLVKLC